MVMEGRNVPWQGAVWLEATLVSAGIRFPITAALPAAGEGAARQESVRQSSCDHPPAFSSAPTCFQAGAGGFSFLPCSSLSLRE